MFPPDRMIAHNLKPYCPSGTELSAYMDREWNSDVAYLGDRGDGGGPKDDVKKPTGLFAWVVRLRKSRVRIPFL